MSYMVIPLSVSPYSSSPVADAIARISTIVGVSVSPAALQQMYWNDPATALGAGTGRWQFQISYTYQPSGDTDPVTLVVSCQGNASSSIGGPKAVSPPSFTGMTQTGCPLFAFPSVGGGGSQAGGASIIRLSISPFSPQPLTDLAAIASATIPAGNVNYRYWSDPQTAYAGGLSTGTGMWMASVSGPQGGYTAQIIGYVGGCALSSVGGPPAIAAPASWTGWTQVKAPFSLG